MTSTVRIRRSLPADATKHVPELAELLIACVEGGASVSFMLPLSQERAEKFWRGVLDGAARGERIVLVAEDGSGAVMGTVQVVLSVPENQPHRGDIAKLLVHPRVRRQGIAASRWLVRWSVGVVGGLVLTAAFFMSVEGAGIDVGWLLEVFFTGFWVAGAAALVSGSTLFSALSFARPQPAVSRARAAESTR